MPRHARNRPRPTRSPVSHDFEGLLIETYHHPDDFPVLSDAPRKRPRHATRGATAAERAVSLATFDLTPSPPGSRPVTRRNSSRNLRSALALADVVRMKPVPQVVSAPIAKPRPCGVCLRKGTRCMLLKCVECAQVVHSYCLNPPQPHLPNGGIWTCQACSEAPVARKKQIMRAFEDAVKKYAFLVSPEYLASVTQSVSMIASTASIPRLSRDSVADLGLAQTIPAMVLKSRPTENTIVLRAPDTESDEIEEMPIKAEPQLQQGLGEGPQQNQTFPKDLPYGRASSVGNIDNQVSPTNTKKQPWGSVPKPDRKEFETSNAGGRCKSARLAYHPQSQIGKASPDHTGLFAPVIHQSKSNPIAANSAALSENGAAATPCVDTTLDVRVNVGSLPQSNRNELEKYHEKETVVLRLRRKPPVGTQEIATPSVRDGETGSHTGKESNAQIEMCKRLAKARAKKAERRRNLLREKQAAEDKVTGTIDLNETKQAEVDFNVSFPAKIMAKMRVAASKEEDVVATGSSRKNLSGERDKARPAPNCRFGLVSPPNACEQDAAETSDLRAQGADGRAEALPRRDKLKSERPNTHEKVPEGASPVVVSGFSSPSSNKKVVGRPNTRGSNAKLTFPSSTEIFKTEENLQLPSVAVGVPDSRHGDVCSKGGAGGQLRKTVLGKKTEYIDLTGEDRETDVIGSKCTPEQRTAAKMAYLFQPSGKANESSSRPMGSRWGDMGVDPKNEALLTIALEQKGVGGKRKIGCSPAGNPMDKEVIARLPKSHPRRDNVPESEKKRMQITALRRAPGTSITTVSEIAGNLTKKSSISRLLSDQPPPEAQVSGGIVPDRPVTSTVIPSSARLTSSPNFPTKQDPLLAQSVLPRHGDAHDNLRKGALEFLTGMPAVPLSPPPNLAATHDARGRTISHQLTTGEPSLHTRGGRPSSPSFQGRKALHKAAVLPRVSVQNPSSHSGSQSEPGSATPGNSLRTLKRPSRRSILAGFPEQYPGRADSLTKVPVVRQGSVGVPVSIEYDPGRDEISRRDWDRNGMSIDVLRTGSGNNRYAGSGYSVAAPSAVHNTVSQTHMLTSEERQVEAMEPPTDLGLHKKSNRSSHWSGKRYSTTNQDEAPPPSIPAAEYEAGSCGHYQASPSPRVPLNVPTFSQSHGQPQSHLQNVNQGSQYEVHSRRLSQSAAESLQDLGRSDTIVADSAEDFLYDHLSDSSRRGRRSAAQTLPTAARRAQYEKGRALAMMTPAAPATDHQHAYSAARRVRGPASRYPSDSFVPPGVWDAGCDDQVHVLESYRPPNSSHVQPSGMPVPVPKSVHSNVEVSRPHVIPIVYEPEIALRPNTQADMPYNSQQKFRSPAVNTRPPTQPRIRHIGGQYRSEPIGGPSNASTTPYHGHVFQPQSMLMHTSHVENQSNLNGMVMDVRDGQSAMYNESRHVQYERTDDPRLYQSAVRPMYQQPAQIEQQPARTDPSLKNLLS